jgi:hypothetical protein
MQNSCYLQQINALIQTLKSLCIADKWAMIFILTYVKNYFNIFFTLTHKSNGCFYLHFLIIEINHKKQSPIS